MVMSAWMSEDAGKALYAVDTGRKNPGDSHKNPGNSRKICDGYYVSTGLINGGISILVIELQGLLNLNWDLQGHDRPGGMGSIPGTGSCDIKIWLSTLGTVYSS